MNACNVRTSLGALCVSLVLCSCGNREGLAPVVDVKWRAVNSHATTHRVEHGETLYAIAFRYDQDYQQLALANHLNSPYTLRVGQVIYLRKAPVFIAKKPQPLHTPPASHPHSVSQHQVMHGEHKKTHMSPARIAQPSGAWVWPVHGRVLAHYAPLQGQKGINIAGRQGDKIHAALSGVVAYAGSGLSGYGNLIIIKHDHQFLTAYGNNAQNLVREGQRVQAGQVIATMGMIHRQQTGVHFEIRSHGKPVNPLSYLGKF